MGRNYAGGVVFYVDGTGQHGLAMATSDAGSAAWGCPGTNVATGSAVGTGGANTAAIVASCADANTAAKLADGLVLNGYDDWFLPSLGEWQLVTTHLYPYGLGGLPNYAQYWTSTQYDANTARYLYIPYMWWDPGSKSSSLRVRAVRAF